ncbi:MAG: hypothetical protein K5685_13715 [Bacteroidales bacterium]|nr:hypothetical protein [Bacteroidales bacterium]
MVLELLLGAALYAAFRKTNSEIDFANANIFTDYLIVDKGSEIPALKRLITRNINSIIPVCKSFKIGKTGCPDNRFVNYKNYDKMILLCQSSDCSVIEVLEAYYNQKYFQHPKNDNKWLGSAGIMTNSENLYFLYMVIC